MSIQEARRATFEKWWPSEMNIQEMDLHRCEFPMQKPEFVQPYACHETQRGFLAWNAALDSVVVELPGARKVPDHDCWSRTNALGYNSAHELCKGAIEAAGIRVEVES